MLRLGAAVITALAALPATAQAVTATATRDPVQISYFGPRDARTTATIAHHLDLQTGGSGESFLVSAAGVEAPLTVAGPIELTEMPSPGIIGDDFGFPGRDGCPGRAFVIRERIYRATLPADATARLSYTLPGPAAAPLDPAQFARTWTIAPDRAGAYNVGPLLSGESIREPSVLYVGVLAKKLTIFARKVGGKRQYRDRQIMRARAGRRVVISGSLEPARSNEKVVLSAFVPAKRARQRIAAVRTNANGRFVYRSFEPRRKGLYELRADYAGQPGAFEATRSPCGGPQIRVAGRVAR